MWRQRTPYGMTKKTLRLSRKSNAFYDDAFGFEVGDAMVGAVTHHDRLFQKSDERAGGFREPAVVGLIPIDGEIVGGVAFGAGERGVEPALEGARGELANRFGAGTNGGDAEVHLWSGYH
jgi:hypothetical protein